MELEDKYKRELVEKKSNISFFKFVEQDIYIDLNNLEKYTVSQLISICDCGKIGNARKKDYITYIRKNMSKSILSDNREYRLNKIFS